MNPGTNPNNPKKIGLAMSGGGIRGVAHLGIMQALVDRGIQFSRLSGTSAGAIAAAFFAQGFSPKETLDIISQAHLFKLLRPSFGHTGLLSILNVEHLLKEYFPGNSFAKLKIPITITAVDLGEGKLVYFNEGDLCKCLLASCCLPGLFRPIIMNEHMYVDGGILNNFPVEPLIGECDFIIGSSCNHLSAVTEIGSFAQMVDRAAMLAINRNVEAHKSMCDVLIEPQGLGNYGIFDTKYAEEIFWLGYEEGLKTIKGNTVMQGILPGIQKPKE
ncbi:patatin-like phospholipase family protein [Mucilaginibacter sp. HMF5004]|uniref:patatin-like phospholipase family protein n=1 Tax=Mucilaginibacter rivuli TaxID=2857527 RepID=UPI001C5FFF29|nr:patatin-like phospholipase family protein [Mucilaginibacter rivuli]MBW4888632.1 patatin-like phospholipase family protein [Mucilaginibacter rivuli]